VSPAPTNLLETVQRLIERTYAMESGLSDLGRFVIGDRGFRELYCGSGAVAEAGSMAGDGAKTLLRETADGPRACVYYPDALIRRLEDAPPQHGLSDYNVAPFATLVEELDHLLVIAERARQGRQLSLFELELHANITKHLVLTRFLAGTRGRVDPPRRIWLRRQLFGEARFQEQDAAANSRYRDAARWAIRFLEALRPRRPHARIRSLRRFHVANASGKLELIQQLA
jgi:hypothetical protein